MRTSGKCEAGKGKKLGRPPLPSSFSVGARRFLPSRLSLSALALAIASIWTFSADTRIYGQSQGIPFVNARDVANLGFRFDVRDYGAIAGDGADDAADIQEAIDAADAAGGGTVIFGPGIYDITTGLTVANDVTVSFEGADNTTELRARAGSSWNNDYLEPMLYIPGPTSGLGNRCGHVSQIRFNGNDLAPVGLHLYALVEWTISEVDIEYCQRVGKIEDGIQNCVFISCQNQRNGSGTTKGTDTGDNLAPFDDAQVVVDHGAANNHHYYEQISTTSPAPADEAIYNLIICQSTTSVIISGYPPHSNVWHGSQIERTATSALGGVLQSAGVGNTISDTTFFVAGSKPMVTVSRQAATGPGGVDAESNSLTLRDCRFSGESASTPILIKANTDSGDAATIVNPWLANIDVFAQASDEANIRLEGSITGAEPATWLTNILDWKSTASSNDETATSLITRTIAKSPIFPTGTPSNGSNYGTGFFVTNHQLYSVYDQGQWRNTFFNPTTRTNLTYGTTVTPSATEGVYQKVSVTNGTGWTLAAPPSTLPGKLLCLEIANASGGAMGTVTFNGVYDLDAAWSAPANGASVTLFFVCDGTNWHEVGRQPAAGGFSNPMTTEGDIILGGASGTPGRLAIGSNGQVLKSNGTTAVWGTDSTGAGGGVATLKENNAAVGDPDITVLDFLGADFDLSESPDQEINIVAAAALTRDAEWDTSAEIISAVGDETGTGALVFATSPTLVTPILGTPTSGTLTNCTGLPVAGITASTSTALGVGSIELGHATDTTLARVSAGVASIEGSNILLASGLGSVTQAYDADLADLADGTLTGSKVSGAVVVSGGTVNNSVIGGTTPAAGTFTTLVSNTSVTCDGADGAGLRIVDGDGVSGDGSIRLFEGAYIFKDGADSNAALSAGSLTLTTDLSVANGGTGASTLTGLLQGNGTSAVTAITNSTTVGQVLRVTGSNTYAWGALDLADGDAVTGVLPAANHPDASTTAEGIVELATTAEINTGTDTGRVIGVDEFVATQFATKIIQCVCIDFTTDVATGDGKAYVNIPASLNGFDIVTVHARVITAGTTGTTDIQIANVTDSVDVLSTKLTIDSTETGSNTAATPAVINTSNDDLATNDLLRIDVDAISTTAPKGLIVTIEARKP